MFVKMYSSIDLAVRLPEYARVEGVFFPAGKTYIAGRPVDLSSAISRSKSSSGEDRNLKSSGNSPFKSSGGEDRNLKPSGKAKKWASYE